LMVFTGNANPNLAKKVPTISILSLEKLMLVPLVMVKQWLNY